MISKIYETENKTVYNNSRKPKNLNVKNIKHDNHREDILMFPKKETNLFLNRVYDQIKNENPMP